MALRFDAILCVFAFLVATGVYVATVERHTRDYSGETGCHYPVIVQHSPMEDASRFVIVKSEAITQTSAISILAERYPASFRFDLASSPAHVTMSPGFPSLALGEWLDIEGSWVTIIIFADGRMIGGNPACI